ncbi:hypothetical protein C8Q80DRAFT_1271711 [Daedaleopsis nitida]|nr:hypothetical protein C8Q80DRAFT_1271711 [Daedaleopsis nitida]
MSDIAQIVHAFSGLSVDGYCAVTACAFLVYEYLITFDQEVRLFWRRDVSGACILFFLNRYLSLSVQLLDLVLFVTPMSITSHTSLINRDLFSGLRAYALCLNKPVSLLVSVLSLAPVGVNVAKYGYGLGGSDDNPLLVVVISRTCLLAADIILVIITWKTIPRRLLGPSTESGAPSLTTIILRNGMIYFIVILTMNVLHLAFSITSVLSSGSFSQITIFTEPVTAILVSRFLLDLQQSNRDTVKLTLDDLSPADSTGTRSVADTLNFASVVSSVGGTISIHGILAVDERGEEDGDDKSSYLPDTSENTTSV